MKQMESSVASEQLSSILIDCEMSYEAVLKKLNSVNVKHILGGISTEEFLKLLF